MGKPLMTIVVEDDGTITVKGQKGSQSGKVSKEDLPLVLKDEDHEILSVIPTTIMVTKKNPTCGWVDIGGWWWWVCG